MSDAFMHVITGRPQPRTDQVRGPQEGTIISVDEVAHRAYVTLSKSSFSTETKFGPAPYSRTSQHPQVGDRALVLFIGRGVDRPWVVAYSPPD